MASPSDDQPILDNHENGDKGASTASKKRGLVRLVLGTFFLLAALMDCAVNAPRLGAGVILAALGAFLLWWGAHGRLGWMRPLGITWIVFGVLALLVMLNLQQVVGQAFRGSAWLLLGGGAMIVVGGMLLFRARKGRSVA